jgi:cytochrome c biogenesis factor
VWQHRVEKGTNPMIAEIGHFALVLAVGVALYQFLVPLYGRRTGGDRALMRTGAAPRRCAAGCC